MTAPRPATSVAEVATEHAARYLVQLCKHFRHKCPETEWADDGSAGRIVLPIGECRLTASRAALSIAVTAAGQESLVTLEDVIARHLVRFAFREPLAIAWRPLETVG